MVGGGDSFVCCAEDFWSSGPLGDALRERVCRRGQCRRRRPSIVGFGASARRISIGQERGADMYQQVPLCRLLVGEQAD
ncbi:hypothetical protein M758_6G050100 [Ceratodon purpureus]|nr:hypothetical protein M758_6G050100 [Ceratodon purpureus]